MPTMCTRNEAHTPYNQGTKGIHVATAAITHTDCLHHQGEKHQPNTLPDLSC